MGLTCNIGRRGRRIRAINGLILLTAGILLLIFLWPPAWWVWLLAAGLVLGGLFSLFEARVGWCAIRAMGLRTPI
ncbi:MAG: hypothetical protein AMXMBFR13_41520 [Phycisphaerae bacterium]